MWISTMILRDIIGDDVEKSESVIPGYQFNAYFIDVSGPHGYHQIIRLAILQ